MYQPRRVTAISAGSTEPSSDLAVGGPRRALPSRSVSVRDLVAPAAVSGTLIATVSALTLNVAATDLTATPAQAATAAPVEAAPLVASSSEDFVEPELVLDSTADVLPGHQSPSDPEPARGKVLGKRYVTSAVKVRTLPDSGTAQVGALAKGAEITVTSKVVDGFRQVTYKGDLAYVADKFLTATKPLPGVYTGATTFSGTCVLGLKPKAMVVYNAVTAKWSFRSIGGYRARSLSNHQLGGAIDFMLTPGKDSAKGWAIAKWVAANHKAFDIDHIIFEQHIWTPYNQTWRLMADRGGTTANHMDHVHVSVKL